MKTLFLDCFSGISGDMFLGAMIDLGFDLEILRTELGKLHLHEEIRLQSKRDQRGGIAGIKFDALLPDQAGHSHSHEQGHTHEGHHPHAHDHEHTHDDHGHKHDHDHSHEDDHGHSHDHPHKHGRSYADIRHLISDSHLSEKVKTLALAIFHRIAVAEAKIHGKTTDDVHFHEVGALDSIVDIIGAAVAIETLGITAVEASPLVEGTGSIQCAHGTFPLPAPATLEILRGIPLRQIDVPHELITPTGAAILAELAQSFTGLSHFSTEKVGYGLGSRNLPNRPNVLRAMLGGKISPAGSDSDSRDQVLVLESNLDDVTGEELGHLASLLADAGALDVSFAPLLMKKNRPGHLLQVIAHPDLQDELVHLIFTQSPAFGLRLQKTDRLKLAREMKTVETAYGTVRVKIGSWEGKQIRIHPEYEDCHRLAAQAGVSLGEVIQAARQAVAEKK